MKELCPFQGLIPSSDSESNGDDQSAESRIPIALKLDDTPDTTRLDAMTHQQMQVRQLSCSGGALGRRGLP